MKVFVYIRVSTRDQNPVMQEEAIKEYIAYKKFDVVQVFNEKKSGKNTDRPAFKAMMTALDDNPQGVQAVVIWKLDRIGRSLLDLLNILEFFKTKKIGLISVTQPIDTTTKEGKLFFNITGAFAEYERENILERTQTGQYYARQRGVKFGRKLKALPMDEITRLIALNVPKTKIARKYGISKSTLYTRLEEYRKQQITEATADTMEA